MSRDIYIVGEGTPGRVALRALAEAGITAHLVSSVLEAPADARIISSPPDSLELKRLVVDLYEEPFRPPMTRRERRSRNRKNSKRRKS